MTTTASRRLSKVLSHLHLEKRSGVLVNNAENEKVPICGQCGDSEKIAFKMYLNEGAIAEYKRRHDLIPSDWPQLQSLLTRVGIRDYSIFFDQEQSVLFGCLWRAKNHKMDSLPDHEVMKKWWNYMSDLMRTKSGSTEPIAIDLQCVFHMK